MCFWGPCCAPQVLVQHPHRPSCPCVDSRMRGAPWASVMSPRLGGSFSVGGGSFSVGGGLADPRFPRHTRGLWPALKGWDEDRTPGAWEPPQLQNQMNGLGASLPPGSGLWFLGAPTPASSRCHGAPAGLGPLSQLHLWLWAGSRHPVPTLSGSAVCTA